MYIVTTLPVLTNWKGDSYKYILVIIDWLVKMIHYTPVKITINASMLAEVIINVIVCYYNLLELIIIYKGFFFTSKFWL